MTYSIVGRDEANGELGVAVQSRAFGVALCAWARPGVGAVATQASTRTEYDRAGQFTLLWNDPALKIWWPIHNPVLSERDQGHRR